MIAEAKGTALAGRVVGTGRRHRPMFLLVLAVNLLGDALRDLLDPRLQGVS